MIRKSRVLRTSSEDEFSDEEILDSLRRQLGGGKSEGEDDE